MNLNRCAGVNVTMLTIIDFSVPASHTQSREFERRERDAVGKEKIDDGEEERVRGSRE